MLWFLWNSDVQVAGGGERWGGLSPAPSPSRKSSFRLAGKSYKSTALPKGVQIPGDTGGKPFLMET